MAFQKKTWVNGEGNANARLNDDAMNNLELRIEAGLSGVDAVLGQYVAHSTDPDERPDAPLVIFVTTTEPTAADGNDIWIELPSEGA